MTRTQLFRKAIQLWYIKDVPKELCHANARKWFKAMERLGDRWVLAKHIEANPEMQPSKATILDKWLLETKGQRIQ